MDRARPARLIAESPLPLALAGKPFRKIRNCAAVPQTRRGKALRDRSTVAITKLKEDGHPDEDFGKVGSALDITDSRVSQDARLEFPNLHVGLAAGLLGYVPLTLFLWRLSAMVLRIGAGLLRLRVKSVCVPDSGPRRSWCGLFSSAFFAARR